MFLFFKFSIDTCDPATLRQRYFRIQFVARQAGPAY